MSFDLGDYDDFHKTTETDICLYSYETKKEREQAGHLKVSGCRRPQPPTTKESQVYCLVLRIIRAEEVKIRLFDKNLIIR